MNILWITTDQQQWRTIAGRSECKMPNIQKLADRGVLFNRSYTPMPVCCPARAMWASGAYPWHNGVHTQVHSAPSLTLDVREDVVIYSQLLKEKGYKQGFVGKWHASATRTPLDFGFDEVCMPICCDADAMEAAEGTVRILPEPAVSEELVYTNHKEFSWPGSEPFEMWGTYSGPIEKLKTTRIADGAIAMIDDYSQGDKPWHVAVHFAEPHDPYNPHEDYLKRYDPASLSIPESFKDTFEGKPGMHRRESESWGDFTEEDVRQGTAHYFAYCEQIDDQIGRILEALDRSGQADDTIIAFTADHGDMLGAHKMWIKSWMPYEEVYKVPLIICAPGVESSVCDHLVQTHDLAHTFLDMTGASPLPFADGRSLKPLLENPKTVDWDDAVLCVGYGCEFFVTQRILITTRYKYVFNGFDFDEMYDLENDENEMKNIIDDSSHEKARSMLRGKLYELMGKYGDPYGDPSETPSKYLAKPGRYGAPRYLPRS